MLIQEKNTDNLVQRILAHTHITVQYSLEKNRVNQRLFISINDFTDELDIFNLMQYLNDRVSYMYYHTVKSTRYIKDFLKSNSENKVVFTQSLVYRIPYAKWNSLFETYSEQLDCADSVIESYIDFYLKEYKGTRFIGD